MCILQAQLASTLAAVLAYCQGDGTGLLIAPVAIELGGVVVELAALDTRPLAPDRPLRDFEPLDLGNEPAHALKQASFRTIL